MARRARSSRRDGLQLSERWVAVRLDPVVSNRELFLWDEIAVVGLGDKIARVAAHDPARAADLEFMAERGFLTELPRTASTAETMLRSVGPVVTETSLRIPRSKRGDAGFNAPRVDPELSSGYERLFALALDRPGLSAVPLVGPRDRSSQPRTPVASVRVLAKPERTIQPIVDVVAARVPVPESGAPLETLLELRMDDELRRHRVQLRRWILAASTSEADIKLLAAELDALRADCGTYLRANQLKATNEVVRALVPSGINVPTVRQALDGSLSLRSRRARLHLGELDAPGRPFAFLDQVGTRMRGVITVR